MSTASGWSIWRRSATPRLVPSAVATVLGLEIRTEDPLPGLVAALRDNRMLLLLDNCEHVIDAAAGLAAALLGGAPGVKHSGDQPRAARGSGRTRVPPRTARQPGAVVRADGHRGGGFPRRAAVRRAGNRDRRRLRADRCERPAGRRDLPEARRLAVGDRVRRTARRGAWGRRPCRPPGRQLAAVGGAAPRSRCRGTGPCGPSSTGATVC